jgi:hypothetical protein
MRAQGSNTVFNIAFFQRSNSKDSKNNRESHMIRMQFMGQSTKYTHSKNKEMLLLKCRFFFFFFFFLLYANDVGWFIVMMLTDLVLTSIAC